MIEHNVSSRSYSTRIGDYCGRYEGAAQRQGHFNGRCESLFCRIIQDGSGGDGGGVTATRQTSRRGPVTVIDLLQNYCFDKSTETAAAAAVGTARLTGMRAPVAGRVMDNSLRSCGHLLRAIYFASFAPIARRPLTGMIHDNCIRSLA